MHIRLNQLQVRISYGESDLLKAVCRRLKCQKEQVHNLEVIRRSIDARKKDREPCYVLTVDATISGKPPKLSPPQVERAPRPEAPLVYPACSPSLAPPVVIGAGPAGLMAALTLAEAGHKPLLIERGAETADREEQVEAFWKKGTHHEESNVLYGEGGAGLFSDGKLTARSKDRAGIRRFFETLVACGAHPDILIDAMPHIGTDELTKLIPALRNRIWALGGACAFNSRLEGILVEKGILRGVVVAGKEIRTDACFLATGHSARDVYSLLHEIGAPLEAKPFAIGVRLEIPQMRIDEAQYGAFASLPQLGAASFRLTRKEEGDARRCYSFCMCPGGLVISCASEAGMLTTNGMSLSGRNEPFGNAAMLVPVDLADFPGKDPLAGIRFQQALETQAWLAGGSDYSLPATTLLDFLEKRAGALPDNRSCSRAVSVCMEDILPDFVNKTLHAALPNMLAQLNGTPIEEALLYGPETRSSAPVRVLRDPKTLQSTGIQGLYPCGEGAGYAGGIVSSALDGMKAAETFIFS
jgi:uncharacterized protein